MSNQVKLIDQTKLLEDFKGRKRVLRDGLNFAKREEETIWADQIRAQMQILTELIECVEEDTYAPDTPPEPTIKPGDIVKHPRILEPLKVVRVGKNWTCVTDDYGQRYDVLVEELEVVE